MNKKELYVFMFYILLIAVCKIIFLLIFGNFKLNPWAAMTIGSYVGFLISIILWKFYGSKYVNS